MKFKYLIYIILFFQVNTSSFLQINNHHLLMLNMSQQQVQNNQNSIEGEVYEDDFAPMLFFLLVFALICIGGGIAITIIILLIVFGLIGAGILSASILVGLNKKSFSKGFKTFLLSTSTIGGLIVGLTVFWAIHEFMELWTLSTSLISGGITGLFSGLLFGYFSYYVIQKLTSYLKIRLKNLQ